MVSFDEKFAEYMRSLLEGSVSDVPSVDDLLRTLSDPFASLRTGVSSEDTAAFRGFVAAMVRAFLSGGGLDDSCFEESRPVQAWLSLAGLRCESGGLGIDTVRFMVPAEREVLLVLPVPLGPDCAGPACSVLEAALGVDDQLRRALLRERGAAGGDAEGRVLRVVESTAGNRVVVLPREMFSAMGVGALVVDEPPARGLEDGMEAACFLSIRITRNCTPRCTGICSRNCPARTQGGSTCGDFPGIDTQQASDPCCFRSTIPMGVGPLGDVLPMVLSDAETGWFWEAHG